MVSKLTTLSRVDLRATLKMDRQATDKADLYLSLSIALLCLVSYFALIFSSGDAAAKMSIGGTWFQSDGWRVFDDMTDFDATHFRDKVHPLFSITSIPISNLLKKFFDLSYLQAIYVINSILFAASNILILLICRIIGCGRLDSVLVCLSFATSAAAIFWFTVPETYPAGCAALLFCLLCVAKCPRNDWNFLLAGVVSLGTTITNWMAALVAVSLSRSVGRSTLISIGSLIIVAVGSLVAKAVFPNPGSPFFLIAGVTSETEYMGHSDSGSIPDRIGGQLLTPMIAPTFKLLYNQPTGVMISFQSTIPNTVMGGDVFYIISSLSLLFVMMAAVIQMVRRPDRFIVALSGILGGQILLHLIYGEETFLYALHFAPLVVLLCAQAFRTQPSNFVRLAMVILIVAGSYNNIGRFIELVNLPFQGTEEFLFRMRI